MATGKTAPLDDDDDDAARGADKRAKRIKRSAKCKAGEAIPAGKAPAKAGKYVVELALTVTKASAPPPPPDEPDEPDEPGPVDPPSPPIITPPSGSKVFRDDMAPRGKGGYGSPVLELRQAKNWVFQGITIDGGGVCEQSLLHGECGQRVLFNGVTIKGFKPRTPDGNPAPFIFPGTNWATSTDDYQLWFINCHFIGIKAEVAELKCSGCKFINCTYEDCDGGIRIRHGVNTQAINNKGLKIVKMRCGPHWSVNNADAMHWLFQGNLPGEADKWPPMHEHGEGFNRQAAFSCRVANAGGVIVGKEDGNAKGYKAKACVVPPGQKNYTEVPGGFEPVLREQVPMPPMPRMALATAAALTRDMSLPALADRTPEQVVARMKVMQEALLNPTHELQMRSEKTGRDEDEEWLEHVARALAA